MLDGRNGSPGFQDGGGSGYDAGNGSSVRESSGFRSGGKGGESSAPKSFEKDLTTRYRFKRQARAAAPLVRFTHYIESRH